MAGSACGIGDEIILARFRESPSDDPGLDAGSDAAIGPDSGDGAVHPPDGGDGGAGNPECLVPMEREPVACTTLPPPGTALPHVKWRFPPASLELKQASPPGTPLVANLTDDNGDGLVNLCDVPDVLLVAGEGTRGAALWLLAGDTGRIERLIEQPLLEGVAPAIADLEGDGVPEIIAIDDQKRLIALKPDGTRLWQGAEVAMPAGVQADCYAVSVYDVEGDGNPEILAGFDAFDAMGNRRFGAPTNRLGLLFPAVLDGCVAPVAADLTGDGQLEMLFGHVTLSPDGKQLWQHRLGDTASIPVVANLDADPQLEVVLTAPTMLYVLEADGSERATLARSCGGNVPSVHDFNGDGIDELAVPECENTKRATIYQLQDNNLVARWGAENLLGPVGSSSVAGFDFDGRGSADLVYADEQASAVYAGADGRMLFEGLRVGKPVVGTPVIADVDNDGSAELLLPAFEAGDSAVLTVISGAPGAWMGARRIWNQHAYHVTNVHEDGRIPHGAADAPKVPLRMRSNAHREGNHICVP
ncbi:MAG: VCBS repeat-containing protein [Myxococcales bacterium]